MIVGDRSWFKVYVSGSSRYILIAFTCYLCLIMTFQGLLKSVQVELAR